MWLWHVRNAEGKYQWFPGLIWLFLHLDKNSHQLFAISVRQQFIWKSNESRWEWEGIIQGWKNVITVFILCSNIAWCEVDAVRKQSAGSPLVLFLLTPLSMMTSGPDILKSSVGVSEYELIHPHGTGPPCHYKEYSPCLSGAWSLWLYSTSLSHYGWLTSWLLPLVLSQMVTSKEHPEAWKKYITAAALL